MAAMQEISMPPCPIETSTSGDEDKQMTSDLYATLLHRQVTDDPEWSREIPVDLCTKVSELSSFCYMSYTENSQAHSIIYVFCSRDREKILQVVDDVFTRRNGVKPFHYHLDICFLANAFYQTWIGGGTAEMCSVGHLMPEHYPLNDMILADPTRPNSMLWTVAAVRFKCILDYNMTYHGREPIPFSIPGPPYNEPIYEPEEQDMMVIIFDFIEKGLDVRQIFSLSSTGIRKILNENYKVFAFIQKMSKKAGSFQRDICDSLPHISVPDNTCRTEENTCSHSGRT